MGVSMNIQKGGNCDYLNAILEIEEAIMYRGMRPWLYPDIIFNLTSLGKKFNSNLHIVQELSKKVLKQKIDKLTNKDDNLTFDNKSNKYSFEKKIRKPFLELLLEYHLKDPSFTEEDVREEIDTFMFAVKYTFPFYTLTTNAPAQSGGAKKKTEFWIMEF
ncbi:Cytochrome P450 4C1 [Araneus ventricosus]|uniref:Cytochrome P450 4C1 n=1 Tax=Araneus ventricosus TaxID=182803 RepID=A0A4Y2UX58_ARAVE|nr:Cytochrome P450 4C1 [Araneus ventricosus]